MPAIGTMIIFEPAPNEEVLLDPYYGTLSYAAGQSNGSQIAGIKALCEPLDDVNSVPQLDCDDVDATGKFVGYQSWSGTQIPGAEEGWNCLHVCTFYYGGYSGAAPSPTHEQVKFNGVTSVGLVRDERRRQAQVEDLLGPLAAATGTWNIGQKLGDLLTTWWERDVRHRTILREPVDRDGEWMLYRHLPVDIPLGSVLGLNGRPLRATSISVAADAVSIRRKAAPPHVHLAVPFGTGETAVGTVVAAQTSQDSGESDEAEQEQRIRSDKVEQCESEDCQTALSKPRPWLFPGFPKFGVIIHQRGYLHDPPLDVSQLLHSVSRESPTSLFVNPNSPIHVAVNSPEFQDWMNDGYINLWVRVNSQ